MFFTDPDTAAKLAALSVEELRQLLANGTMEGRLPIGKAAAFATAKEYAENYLDVMVIGGEAKPELDEWRYHVELHTANAQEVELWVQAYTGEIIAGAPEQAIGIAVHHAGATRAQVTNLEGYFDRDYRYVTFYYNGFWYNYKFDYYEPTEILDWMKTTEQTFYGDTGPLHY